MEWIQLALSLGAVTLGAEALVRGASMLALRMHVSPLFVGLTIVGFGTSSPELAASLAATLEGAVDVSVGNVVGSNIFNIGVIVGITALVCPIRARLRAIRRDLLVALAAAVVPWVALGFGGSLPRGIGIALLAALLVYVVAAFRAGRRAPASELRVAEEELRDTVEVPSRPFLERTWFLAALVVAGLALLVGGSRVFVESAVSIARATGMSDLVIGLTIVSAGTSLPELVTSLVAGARRNTDIAIGNIIGSNIFNVFGILGLSAVVRPQMLAPRVLAVDVPVMLLATLALVPVLRRDGVITRAEGGALLVGYSVYLGALLARGG